MFRIGDFSRLARVTIRTLHHYDEAGLLVPTHVDAQTGYRYYLAAQLEVLQRILLLKDLGFTLEEIRALLQRPLSGPELAGVLEVRRAQLAHSIVEDQARMRRLEVLRDFLVNPATAGLPVVTLREVPAMEVHAIRARVPRLGTPVQVMFETAEAVVARARARAEASPFMVFHDLEYREEDADVEVCIPVKAAAPRQIATRVVSACAAVGCVTYSGSYDQTPALYSTMLTWMERTGLKIDGPLREVYHRFGANQIGYQLPAHMLAESSAEYVTELQVPVVRLPASGEGDSS
jgi:DNA-binding transcriptional MerR regulator/effector-binding domain-containing protein